MPSDDILDLLGRYATGSLSAEEQKRLFEAAVDDQDLFDQLVREQDMKQLLDEPGARDRMIRALEPPKRKTAWIFGIAATAALSAALVVVLLHQPPKPPQMAVAKIPAPITIAQPETAPPPPPPVVQSESAPLKAKAVESRRDAAAGDAVAVDEPSKDAVKKEAKQQEIDVAPAVSKAAAPAQARAQTAAPQQQNAVNGGPRQNLNQAIAGLLDSKTAPLALHYSIEIPGHLSIIPAIDGFLSVKTNDGTVLFGPKLSAAGIIVDLPIADTVSSVFVTFAENSSPVQTKPTVHAEINADVRGSSGLAIEVRIKGK